MSTNCRYALSIRCDDIYLENQKCYLKNALLTEFDDDYCNYLVSYYFCFGIDFLLEEIAPHFMSSCDYALWDFLCDYDDILKQEGIIA